MWLDRFDAFLCDLDGCLISGELVLPGAEAFVARAGERLQVLSNNSTDTPETLSRRLATHGLAVPPERILLAGAFALDRLAAGAPGARLALFGTEAMRDRAGSLGLDLVTEAPEHVLLTRHPGFDYAALNAIVRHVLKGARLIAANPDATHPGADGYPVAETGALLAAIRACLPDLRPVIVGKPEPALYEAALGRLRLPPERVLAIGDNPLTDGAGAERARLPIVIIGASPAAAATDLDALLRTARDPRLPAA